MNFSRFLKKSSFFSEKIRLKNKSSISVFGLGKVGTAIAAVALENKYQVYGFDIDKNLLKNL